MNRANKDTWVATLLLSGWLLVVVWQFSEHRRVTAAAQADLRNRAHEIAGTLGAVTRALKFRSAVFQDRLDPVLNELARVRTNALVSTGPLLALGLLNNDGDVVVAAGETNLLTRETGGESERWSDENVIFVLPVEGASVTPEGATNNLTVVLPAFRNFTNNFSRDNRSDFSDTNFPPPRTNIAGQFSPPPPDDNSGHQHDGERPRGRDRRPPWMRGMSDAEFHALAAKRELHGLVLVMSTENFRAVVAHDWWLRAVIAFFAGVSALGAGLAWRNIARTAELQIRLVRASEQNSHLKELNLAAAGLAHETRNPLNIIRGQAQMLARAAGTSADAQEKSRIIIGETDKVTAQLTEFINYSRPREVRRARVSPAAIASEVVRTLGFDIEEKNLTITASGGNIFVEADEQLLRQVLFNLILNAIQAAEQNGKIQFTVFNAGKNTATVEIRDDGPGVPPENRSEIFKPYFTTHQKGTGLGLAVVQQIVSAHGWEIACLPNEPRGAIFRISDLRTLE
jgi:signal transduction histidine kinase